MNVILALLFSLNVSVAHHPRSTVVHAGGVKIVYQGHDVHVHTKDASGDIWRCKLPNGQTVVAADLPEQGCGFVREQFVKAMAKQGKTPAGWPLLKVI